MNRSTPTLQSLPLDHSPRNLAARFAALPYAAILESAPGFGDSGRWSIYAARPRLAFAVEGRSFRTLRKGVDASSIEGDPLGALASLLHRHGITHNADNPPDPDLPPFQGGFIGFLGYDIAPLIERLPRRLPRDSSFPDIWLGLYDTYATYDHATRQSRLWAADLLGEGTSATVGRLHDFARRLDNARAHERHGQIESPRPDLSRIQYLTMVRRALDYIAAGDVFQVNLSHRFMVRATQADSFALYTRLTRISPAPFGVFLRLGGNCAVVSASPEWFYQIRGRQIVTRPIKGTRPRGTDEASDHALAQQLASSHKDRAELTMIIDLERNDLGRVCEFGSVRVVEPYAVESFAQVHHLVATVEGRLRGDIGPVDVVRALFPGGSITGAPKIRAMQIIDELECNRRGLYTGAIGYFSRGGNTAFNIAIRTMVLEKDRITYQVGGGIVADSDPEAEYQETLDKGAGMERAITSL